MKKFIMVLAVMALAITTIALAEDKAAKEFVVYTDKNARDNHYIPAGWMGDYGDIKMNDQSAENPHTGSSSIQFVYNAKKTQNQGWAGVYWQSSANNWGSKKSGFDLTGMNKLTFWARGAKGGEVLQKVVIGGIKGTYPDSAVVEMGPIELTDSWKQYTVNLAGKDLSYINGGLSWTITSDQNSDGATFYIDDIKFESDSTLKPEGKLQQAMPFYIYSDRSSTRNHYIPSGWMGDYGDLKYEGVCKEDPYLGDSCIKITYNGKRAQGAGWAGMMWQNPANNWGTVDAGFDLSKATSLTFWARGVKGGERVEEFKVGGIMGEYSDSDSSSIGPVILNKEWTQYTIDLKGKDMSNIIGGFVWSANVDTNPDGIIFYLDEIKFE
ncbi:MAG: hypothetical protein NTZ63_06390 [Candidatus Omnitrophica bacterium]|nr:hypothetical protein [Candidatus Omnitrophota bacterium]